MVSNSLALGQAFGEFDGIVSRSVSSCVVKTESQCYKYVEFANGMYQNIHFRSKLDVSNAPQSFNGILH